jgi:hypothetical protein
VAEKRNRGRFQSEQLVGSIVLPTSWVASHATDATPALGADRVSVSVGPPAWCDTTSGGTTRSSRLTASIPSHEKHSGEYTGSAPTGDKASVISATTWEADCETYPWEVFEAAFEDVSQRLPACSPAQDLLVRRIAAVGALLFVLALFWSGVLAYDVPSSQPRRLASVSPVENRAAPVAPRPPQTAGERL